MAVTRAIDLKTEIPGRARGRSSSARRASSPIRSRSTLPVVVAEATRRDAHRRRRQHVHRLHRRRRLPQRRPLAPARRRGGAGAARAVRAHRLHDRPVRGLRRARRAADSSSRPFAGPAKAAFFNAGTEAVENAVKFARSYTKRPAVIAFEGGFHGRTLLVDDADLEDAPVQGGARAVRARGLPRAVRATTTAGRPTDEALARARARVHDAGRAGAGRRDRGRAGAGRGRLRRRAAGVPRGPARICDEHGIVLVVDEVQTGFGRTGPLVRDRALRHRARPDDRREVDRRRAAALGRDRQGRDHGRAAATRRSAARTSAIRSRRPRRSPSSTSSRRRASSSARRSSARRSAARMLAWQERFPAIGDVRGLGAMLAIELVEDRETKRAGAGARRARSSTRPPQRGLLLLKAGIYSNCIRVLSPLVITDARARRGARRPGKRRSKRRSALSRARAGERLPRDGRGGGRRALRARGARRAPAACRASTGRTTRCSSATSR